MTETMTLTVKLEADSLLRTARMLEAAADALDPGATDAALRQEALEAEHFARTVARMTAEEVQRVLGATGKAKYTEADLLEGVTRERHGVELLEGDDATQRSASAEAEDNDDPAGYEGTSGDDDEPPVWSGATASPPASSAPVPAEPERDSAGYVWDARIHASTRTKTKDGRWKYMRGVDDALVAEVESAQDAERSDIAPDAAEEAHPLEAAQSEVEYKPMQHTPPPGFKEHVPGAAVPPPPPAATPDPAAPAGELIPLPVDDQEIRTFRELMPYIGKHKFTQAQLMDACKAAGAQSVPILMQRQDLIPAVVTALEAQRAAKA